MTFYGLRQVYRGLETKRIDAVDRFNARTALKSQNFDPLMVISEHEVLELCEAILTCPDSTNTRYPTITIPCL